jgi:hypothetical protein
VIGFSEVPSDVLPVSVFEGFQAGTLSMRCVQFGA